jgi:hypothetical protein
VTARGRRRVQDLEDELDRRRGPGLRAWAPQSQPERRAELARDYLERIANAGDTPEAVEAGEAFLRALEALDAAQEVPDAD